MAGCLHDWDTYFADTGDHGDAFERQRCRLCGRERVVAYLPKTLRHGQGDHLVLAEGHVRHLRDDPGALKHDIVCALAQIIAHLKERRDAGE